MKIFIDGSAGTTGLKIHDRIKNRKNVELITLSDENRKDEKARKEAINASDVTFLCLPDAAAIEAAAMVENHDTVIIDTSTAHRTAENWTYGFAEIGKRAEIAQSKRIANPGCHASGFISLVYPLVKAGIIPRDALLSAYSLTGYSGGGKKMIAEYESESRNPLLDSPRVYGLTQNHKHLPEMMKLSGLENAPAFFPVVGDFYSGMQVTVPLFASQINGNILDIKEIYRECYHSTIVHFNENGDENGFTSTTRLAGMDDMSISVFGNDERIMLVSRYDNLGKGASGAAIQNLNIVCGLDETEGLILSERV